MEMAIKEKMFVEISEILQHLDFNLVMNIPIQIRNIIQSKKNNSNYSFYYDESKPVEQQDILKETRTLLVLLYYNYIANKDEREVIKNILIENENK